MLASTFFQLTVLAAALAAHAFPHSPFRHRSAHTASNNANMNRQDATSSSSDKLVVAHHMVGNTYPYTVDNWAADIALAHASGLDGFALNVGIDEWQPARVADAYTAAANSNTGFKLFISFDMSSLPCTAAADAQLLRTYITDYATHPNQLLVNGQVFASTFSGSDCTFGQGSSQAGWSSQFLQQLTGQNTVHFVPSFFIDPTTFSEFDEVMDGSFNWNGAWPISVTSASPPSDLGGIVSSLTDSILPSSVESQLNSTIGVFSTDEQYIGGMSTVAGGNGPKTYIASVSPWFFTHYSPQTYNKNWIYLSDYWLYNSRWETLIENRDSIDVVELLTWNDYGESHYVGPIEGAQPEYTTWATGFNHTGWLAMTNYYASAFRTGSYPTITQDELYIWARPHSKNAQASNDPMGPPTNYELTEDKMWAVVFATQPATVTLTTGSPQTFDVPAGVTKLSLALQPGAGMSGSVSRNGNTVVDVQAPGYTFETNPTTYNFNAYVAYATSG